MEEGGAEAKGERGSGRMSRAYRRGSERSHATASNTRRDSRVGADDVSVRLRWSRATCHVRWRLLEKKQLSENRVHHIIREPP